MTPTPPKPDESAKDHAAVMKKLNGLKGAEFDKAFLQNEVALSRCGDRRRDGTLPAIQNAELKQLVTTVAPAFVAHRDAAKNMLEHGTMSKM